MGSSSCRECHGKFYELWAPSHHGTAMQPYTPVLAKAHLQPQKAPISILGTNYFAELAEDAVLERSPGGVKRYPIAHAMGGKNVFYFLTPMTKGRLQVLPIAYDLKRKEWFDTAASAMRHLGAESDAPLPWLDAAFTFNTSCYNCHVSQLSKNYDLASDTYNTTWSEPGINCETCHGPGGEHIRAARALPKGQELKDLKLVATGSLSTSQANALCASCHAKIYPLSGSFPPGDRFFDHFGLAGLEDRDFYPDGRDLGENFTETSWRLSGCMQSGKLDCTHCHTSSGRFRFQKEQSDRACLPCHQDKVAHAAAHSHHKAGTDGAQCISCHMPMTEFARMRRSDHSMRAPAPASSLVYRSPNACNLCHADKDAAWSDRAVRQWQKDDYQAPVLAKASWIAAARKQDWSRLPEISKYLADPNREEIWAASLLQLLRPCPDKGKWPAILECLKDRSPLVRAAAVDACADELSVELLPSLLPAVKDEFRLVRIRAAAALAPVPKEMIAAEDQPAFERANSELRASLLAHPDNSASHYNLGNFFMERREYTKAIDAFSAATRLQPQNVPALVNSSLAYNALGSNDRAEQRLREALRFDPTNAIANLNFGMLLAEKGKPVEAEKAFRTAFQSDPKSAAAAYNLGVLLAKSRPDEALVWCRRAVALQPRENKYSYTLAFFLRQAGQSGAAIEVLEAPANAESADPDSYALLGALYRERNEPDKALRLFQRAAENPHLPEAARRQFAKEAQLQSIP